MENWYIPFVVLHDFFGINSKIRIVLIGYVIAIRRHQLIPINNWSRLSNIYQILVYPSRANNPNPLFKIQVFERS